MSNQARIDEIEAALIGHTKVKLPALAGQIEALTQSDVNEDDQIVTDAPAVRFLFAGASMDSLHSDQTALDYQCSLFWTVLCGAENRRGLADEKQDALSLVSDVCDALAGAWLENIPSHTQHLKVGLRRGDTVKLFQMGATGTWYAVNIEVYGVSQYEANAAAA